MIPPYTSNTDFMIREICFVQIRDACINFHVISRYINMCSQSASFFFRLGIRSQNRSAVYHYTRKEYIPRIPIELLLAGTLAGAKICCENMMLPKKNIFLESTCWARFNFQSSWLKRFEADIFFKTNMRVTAFYHKCI